MSLSQSEALFQRSQRIAPGGVHSPVRAFKSVGGTPVFFRSAQGPYLETVDGQRLIDFCMGFGPHILGHRDADVTEAVHRAVDTAWAFGACEPYSLELAEWVVEQVPFVEKIRFVCSGTEAVMSALRVARGVTGRTHVVKFEGCYHGHVDSLLVKAGSGLAGEAAADSSGVPSDFAQTTLVLPLDDEAAAEKLFHQRGEEIAAVILEPLPANYGLLAQRDGYWRKIAQWARAYGALVIFDEVISGFRVAQAGMAQRLDLEPDLVTYGKVLGGGMPVGAYGGRSQYMSQVAPEGPVYQAGTLSASPVGMIAGLTTLKKMKALKGYEVLEKRIFEMGSEISSHLSKKGYPLEFTNVASIFWFHGRSDEPIRSVSQIPSRQAETYKKLFHECLKRGVYLAPSGYEVGFLSLAHDDSVLEQACHIIQQALDAVYDQGPALA